MFNIYQLNFKGKDMTFSITSNKHHRFEIDGIHDQDGVKKNGKPQLSGINGYYGPLANIIGWIAEKIFHKTISVEILDPTTQKKSTCYFNCKSLINWYNRVAPNIEGMMTEKTVHDSEFVQIVIADLVKSRAKKDNSPQEVKDQAQEKQVQQPIVVDKVPEAPMDPIEKMLPIIHGRNLDSDTHLAKAIFRDLYKKEPFFTEDEIKKDLMNVTLEKFIDLTKNVNLIAQSKDVNVEIFPDKELTFPDVENTPNNVQYDCYYFKRLGESGFRGTYSERILGLSATFVESYAKADSENKKKMLSKVFYQIQRALDPTCKILTKSID